MEPRKPFSFLSKYEQSIDFVSDDSSEPKLEADQLILTCWRLFDFYIVLDFSEMFRFFFKMLLYNVLMLKDLVYTTYQLYLLAYFFMIYLITLVYLDLKQSMVYILKKISLSSPFLGEAVMSQRDLLINIVYLSLKVLSFLEFLWSLCSNLSVSCFITYGIFSVMIL